MLPGLKNNTKSGEQTNLYTVAVLRFLLNLHFRLL